MRLYSRGCPLVSVPSYTTVYADIKRGVLLRAATLTSGGRRSFEIRAREAVRYMAWIKATPPVHLRQHARLAQIARKQGLVVGAAGLREMIGAAARMSYSALMPFSVRQSAGR